MLRSIRQLPGCGAAAGHIGNVLIVKSVLEQDVGLVQHLHRTRIGVDTIVVEIGANGKVIATVAVEVADGEVVAELVVLVRSIDAQWRQRQDRVAR